jgi:hypothetical protein
MSTLSNFERFRQSCFDQSAGAARDGLDTEATSRLVGEDRAEAERLVLDALTETNDSRPFIAAGVLRLRAASPILKNRLSSGFKRNCDYLKVHAAHSLYLIENWSGAADVITGVLTDTPKTPDRQWTRMMAIESLADLARETRCCAALFAAVEDEDDFIGFLAIQSLKKAFKPDASISALLEQLEKTQIKPNRWVSEFLQERERIIQTLGRATGIDMPSIAMRKEDAQQEHSPYSEQLPLFTDGDA